MNKPDDISSSQAQAVASALRTLESEAEGVAALSRALGGALGSTFSEAVARLTATRGRVVVTGMGKSGHIGRKIAATFASTGTPALFVHPGEASHGDLGMIGVEDAIIALSWSGETAELKALIDYSRRFRILLVAISANADSALGRAADISLVLPKVREACPHNLAPTTSALMQLAIGDALAVALLEGRGFTASDFGVFHPGGRLGAVLRFVRDVMHPFERLPLVAAGTVMADALVTMTQKGFGCVGILDAEGRLAGIVTDGDLRRHMHPGLLAEPVEAVMTARPKSVRPDQLASEALEMLNSSKVTALFVVEEARPVGLLHVHDLLRAGIA